MTAGVNHASVSGPLIETADYQAVHVIDDASIPVAKVSGLGTLATQSGTFSGTSSGTNTGDQTNISGNAATVTTNANLSGDVSSVGNTTTIGAGKVTEAMQVLANNSTQNVSTSKHGYAPILPNDATKFLDGTGAYSVPAGSGGGAKTPTVSNSALAQHGNSQNPAITIAAASTGHALILGLNIDARPSTGVSSTNTTWTKVGTYTSGGATYELWVGIVAGGSSGTTITVTTGSSNFWGAIVMEITDVLTPTAGGSSTGANPNTSSTVIGSLSGVTAGHLIGVILGCDNSTAAVAPTLGIPHVAAYATTTGVGIGMCLGYSAGGTTQLIQGYQIGSGVGGFVMVEIT